MRVNLGSHRLHPTVEPRILAELRALLGDDLQRRPRNGRIRLGGRWIAFPLRPLDLAAAPAAGDGRRARCATRPSGRSAAAPPREDTFEEVLRAALGPTLCERFYFPYARKLWGLDPARAGGRAGPAPRGGALARTAGARGSWRAGARASGTSSTPAAATASCGRRWPTRARAAGAEVLLDAEATPPRARAGRRARRRSADGRDLEARRVWSTLPVTALARMVEPAPPAEALAAADALAYRAMVLVYLVARRGRATPLRRPLPARAARRRSRASRSRATTATATTRRASPCCAPRSRATPDGDLFAATAEELGRVAVEGLVEAGLPRPEVARGRGRPPAPRLSRPARGHGRPASRRSTPGPPSSPPC